MSVPPEQFSRIQGRVDLERLSGQLVVMVGVGTVGSQIADDLARSGVGRFRFVDGDKLERPNLARHALTERFVGRNKAEALTEFLADELNVPGGEAVPHDVTDEVSDEELDALLEDADLIVSATDQEAVQRRIARRALALDIPAVIPALYERGGGEVVVQLSPASPCFLCWAAHRQLSERIRGVSALNVHAAGINELATRLCLGLLDTSSEFSELLQPEPGQDQPQLFVRNELMTTRQPLQRRPGCPSCAVGPARPEPFSQPVPNEGDRGRSIDAATEAVAPWAFAFGAGGFAAALVLALLAAHSFQIYDKAGYAYGHALWFLLQTVALSTLPVLASLWIWEFMCQQEQARRPSYAEGLIERQDYRRTILIAAAIPAAFLYLVHGFGPVTPPPWWWMVSPLCACVAHVCFLSWERLESSPAGDGYWIGGAAATVLLLVALVVGFPA